MEKRVLKRSLCRLLVVFLVATFALCLFPGMVRAETLLQLTDPNHQYYKPELKIDSLVFSDFSVPHSGSSNLSPPNLENISVEKIGEETLKPGLKFVLNGELWIPSPSVVTRLKSTFEKILSMKKSV